jgi:maltose-binding protein MalE
MMRKKENPAMKTQFKHGIQMVFALLILISILLMSGCASQTETASPPPEPTSEGIEEETQLPSEPTSRSPVDLTVWVYNMDDEDVLNTFISIANEWAEINGDTVTVVNYPYFELLGKVEIAFPAGEGPDLTEMPHTDVGVWGQAGLIAAFPEGVLSEEEEALYYSSALDAFRYEGEIYGIPQIADTVLLM